MICLSSYTGLELTFVKGDRATVDFIVKDIDGIVQDVSDFTTIEFKYKKYGDLTTNKFLGSVVSPGTNGKIRFTMNFDMEVGDYDCEISLTAPGEEIITCPDIVMHIIPEL